MKKIFENLRLLPETRAPKEHFKVALRFSGVNFVSLNFIDYVSMALCMGDNRVGDTSGQLAMPQEMGLARRGFTSGTSSPS